MFLQVIEMKTTKKEILQLEQRILMHLNFKLGNPTSYDFLTHLLMLSQCEENIEHLAKENCELSLLSAKTLSYPNSTVAARVLRSSVKRENPPYTEDLPKSLRFASVKRRICPNPSVLPP